MIGKLLLILGGMRVGDTFHLTPFFEENKDYDITWITGTYEKQAALFLQEMFPNISKIEFKDDGFPGSLNDRINFSNFYKNLIDRTGYNKIVEDCCVSFDTGPLSWQLKDTYFNFEHNEGDYIVYHLDTISDWKKHSEIRGFDPVLPGYSLGTPGNYMVPGTTDFRGRPLKEVAQLICNSKLFVGIHSACACLNFYLNKRAIVIHPMDSLMKFGDFRKDTIDLIKPTKEELSSILCNYK